VEGRQEKEKGCLLLSFLPAGRTSYYFMEGLSLGILRWAPTMPAAWEAFWSLAFVTFMPGLLNLLLEVLAVNPSWKDQEGWLFLSAGFTGRLVELGWPVSVLWNLGRWVLEVSHYLLPEQEPVCLKRSKAWLLTWKRSCLGLDCRVVATSLCVSSANVAAILPSRRWRLWRRRYPRAEEDAHHSGVAKLSGALKLTYGNFRRITHAIQRTEHRTQAGEQLNYLEEHRRKTLPFKNLLHKATLI